VKIRIKTISPLSLALREQHKLRAKRIIFYVVTPYCSVELQRRFVRTCHFATSGSKSKPSNKPDCGDEGCKFVRKIGFTTQKSMTHASQSPSCHLTAHILTTFQCYGGSFCVTTDKLFTLNFSGTWHHIIWLTGTSLSEEHSASIFSIIEISSMGDMWSVYNILVVNIDGDHATIWKIMAWMGG
jgi:hypothetical protein